MNPRRTIGQALLARLWWGPLRRPFEALARRAVGQRILTGPLAGRRWPGSLSERLGIYEIHVQEALGRLLQPGDTFYDVGGNRGYCSLLGAARVGPEGRVLVFEPLPENAAFLRTFLAGEGLEVHEVAVADDDGEAELHWNAGASTAVPSLVGEHGIGENSVRVRTVRLDSVIADHPFPDVVKVDVEGAEERVLRGASALLARRRTRWLIEVHSAPQDAAVRALLAENGYGVEELESARRRDYPRHVTAERL